MTGKRNGQEDEEGQHREGEGAGTQEGEREGWKKQRGARWGKRSDEQSTLQGQSWHPPTTLA